jgi:hypothetical protein
LSGFFFLPSQIESLQKLILCLIHAKPVDMRRSLLVFAVLCCGYAVQAQKPMSIKIKDPIICYASSENHPHYIAPPEEYLRRAGRMGKPNSSNLTNATVIEVTYLGFEGVPQAQAAFQKAVDIWASVLVTTIPIRIEARWVQLAPGVLGSANYTAAYANFKDAPRLGVFYPVAIAEKITGTNLNGNDPDIFANFSSTFNWHFDPDDPSMDPGQYDLTTVVLHEIGHGLGFSGTFTTNGTQGSFGLFGTEVPNVYDSYINSGLGDNLLETVALRPTELSSQITSNSLFFKTPTFMYKIYAPTTYNGGSSISHLDEVSYNNSPNALMTPQIASQERIRNPGISRDVLYNLGWEIIRINHHELPDSEDLDGPYTVTANILADNGYVSETVQLHHTLDGTNFTTVTMTPQGNDVFTADIPAQGDARSYGYYISVRTTNGTEYVNPGTLIHINDPKEQLINIFKTGSDLEKPIITHTKELYVLNTKTELVINAEISDNIGSLNAVLEYSINNVEQDDLTFTLIAPEEDSIYTATINFTGLVNGDEIKYRIIATDNSSNHNQTVKDFTVAVIGFKPAQTSYQNTFSNSERNDEFFGEGFTISTPAGFDNQAIHSEHPYISGADFVNNERELIYQLRVPIIVQASDALIKYDEIALIEPGAPGSFFGGPNFYDYVIVEGSSDQGETWEYLAPGYNCRFQSVWLTRYASAIDGDGNSTAVATPELYKQHQINMLQTFDPGTEISIRFRMYIDELAAGWGWAMDNLAIQTVITETDDALETGLHLYPNPTSEKITVEASSSSSPEFSIQLLTLQGQKVYEATEQAVDGKMAHTIAASHLASGMYLVKISNGSKSAIRKVIKTN